MAKPVMHWAEIAAEKIIRERGDKPSYTVASGITPSGTVHFGNFREVITVDLVARALRSKGKQVRFIFSWDDFDTFRKIPANVPKQDQLEEYLYQPIVDVPDPWESSSSYARNREEKFERELERVGVECEYLYQSRLYQEGAYLKQILTALRATEEIKAILNKFRSTPLGDGWLPISIYCPKHKTDRISQLSWDGGSLLSYTHESGYQGELDLDNEEHAQYIKLPWRVDWPMRWASETVDFEPGGKDHSSDGGSFSTGKEIVLAVYGGTAPIYLQYDFVSVKGQGGKMSSSKGNLVSLTEILEVYEPEMVRWIFASYRPNVDFSVGFDADVIKNYEAFDRQERLAFGLEEGNEKKVALAKKVYEFSQLGAEMPQEMPFQPSFRHLTTLIQIFDGDLSRVRQVYQDEIRNERDELRFQTRADCACNWLVKHAPEEFKFSINPEIPRVECSSAVMQVITRVHDALAHEWDTFSDKSLHDRIYSYIHEHEAAPSEVFRTIYQLLIGRDKGPRLASFIRTAGRDRILPLLKMG